ncbi:MAG TPA: MaoC/PaaZ C-terminal domain-containing protein, partial [Acidobacteriota bacterium]|nr:MaoC/PaaZ C-terminal domain-containing protein [Acidobacteriota bacterium]
MSEHTPRTFSIGECASLSKTITETDVTLYAGITGDFNPVHIDAEYAKTTRFGARIAHG